MISMDISPEPHPGRAADSGEAVRRRCWPPIGRRWPIPAGRGRFGDFGGRYVPEALIPACEELEAAYREARADPSFQRS